MPRSLIVRIVVPAAAILSLAGQAAWARGPACWNLDELPAAQLHAFHTTLMVGALRCRSERPDALNSYNAFVEARKASINAARTVVEARFIRDMGFEAGLTEFKNFDTEIANRASIAGHDGMPCDGVDTYSRLAASASQADLYTFSRLNNPGVEIRSCGSEPGLALADATLHASRRDVSQEAEPMVVATAKSASGEAPQAVSSPTPALAHQEAGDVRRPAMQPASQTQAIGSANPPSSTGEAAAPDANGNADAAKALEDAARALAAAASSLRTASPASH